MIDIFQAQARGVPAPQDIANDNSRPDTHVLSLSELVYLRRGLTQPGGKLPLFDLDGKPVPTRLTIERPAEKGRLLTIVSDTPIAFLGAGMPGAKPKEGFDFGIVDLMVDAAGSGTGTISPAAKVTVKQGAFVVDEYSGELVRLTGVKRTK